VRLEKLFWASPRTKTCDESGSNTSDKGCAE
jgi:hypothetical protein